MPTPSPPHFCHNNEAVKHYIDTLFKSANSTQRNQLILMAGIALSDTKLIQYACSIDSSIINTPVPQGILNATDAVLSEVTGHTLSTTTLPTSPLDTAFKALGHPT